MENEKTEVDMLNYRRALKADDVISLGWVRELVGAGTMLEVVQPKGKILKKVIFEFEEAK